MSERLLLTGYYASSGGGIYFETRRRFTRSDVWALGEIEGMIRYDTHNYQVSIAYGRAFEWMDIAPQVVLVLADALGVDLDDLELVDARYSYQKRNQDVRLSEVFEIATRLRKRRPFYARVIHWLFSR